MKPSAVAFDTASSRTPGWQVAQRVQYVVSQVTDVCAGMPESEVARVLTQRLRGIGVSPNDRDVQRYAQAIADLPRPR